LIFAIGQQLATLAVGAMFLLVIWYRPGWAVLAAISIAVLLDCLQVGADGLGVNGGVIVYVDDVACLLLLLAGVLVILRYRQGIPRDAVPCLLLMAALVMSFGRGLSIFGLKASGNSVRNYFTFTAAALVIMLLGPALRLDAGRLARWLGWAGLCMSAVALLRWAAVLPMPIQLQDDLREVVRSLPAGYAIVVGQAFIAAIYLLMAERGNRWWWGTVAAMLGVITLVLQHRSVWVATAAGAAWFAIRTGRRSAARWLTLGATAVVALSFLMIAQPTIIERAREIVLVGVNETQDEHSTWAWRVQGYTEATDRMLAGNAADMFIGPPAGWWTNTDASFAAIHIHGLYVETLDYYGFVGASALAVWFTVLIRRGRLSARIPSKMPPLPRNSRAFLQAILLSELIFFVPYGGGILQGAVLGLLWVAATQGAPKQIGRRLAPVYAGVRCTANSAIQAIQQ
jgi:hypothetical protein